MRLRKKQFFGNRTTIRNLVRFHGKWYIFNNKKSSYKIDFCLPQYKLQVETKDNHIWHQEQVKSGKWAKKEEAAINYCTKNGMKYVLLFPNEIEEFFKNLLKR